MPLVKYASTAASAMNTIMLPFDTSVFCLSVSFTRLPTMSLAIWVPAACTLPSMCPMEPAKIMVSPRPNSHTPP